MQRKLLLDMGLGTDYSSVTTAGSVTGFGIPDRTKNDICYNCKQKGHWAFACPDSRMPPMATSNGRDIPELPCRCGAGPCLILTSSTSKNPGRKFYRCPAWRESDSCGFFLWCNLASDDQILRKENITEEDTSALKEVADAAVIDKKASKMKVPEMNETELLKSIKKMKIFGEENTCLSGHILSEDMLDLDATVEAFYDLIVDKKQEANASDAMHSSLDNASGTTHLSSSTRKEDTYMGCDSVGSNSSPLFHSDSSPLFHSDAEDVEDGKSSPAFDGTGLNAYLLEKMKNDVCYSCKQMGHWAQYCTKKIRRKSQSSDTDCMNSDISDLPEKTCPCGIGVCLILISGTKKNPGRKFYQCPLGREEGNCGYFQWCDLSATNSKQSEANLRGPMCSCGAGKTHLYTMKEGPKAGQKYFGCPIKRGQGACNFFQLYEVYTETSSSPLLEKHDLHSPDSVSDTKKVSETSGSHNLGHYNYEVGVRVLNNLKDEGSYLSYGPARDDMACGCADESISLHMIEMLNLHSSDGTVQTVALNGTLLDSACSSPTLPNESFNASDSMKKIISAGSLSPPPSMDGTQSSSNSEEIEMWSEADDDLPGVSDVSHSMILSMREKQTEDNPNCKLKGEGHQMDARSDSSSNDRSSSLSSPVEKGSGSGCNSDGADLLSNEASILEQTVVIHHKQQCRMAFHICYKCGKAGHRKRECTQ